MSQDVRTRIPYIALVCMDFEYGSRGTLNTINSLSMHGTSDFSNFNFNFGGRVMYLRGGGFRHGIWKVGGRAASADV